MDSTSTVTLIGAGLMGHALALVHAVAGCRVKMQDISGTRLESAMVLIENALDTMIVADAVAASERAAVLGRITPVPDLADAVADADLVVEAVFESADVKTGVYAAIDASAPAGAILASNTSYLDVFPLIPARRQPRCLITHWYTPPYIIDLVDLAPGPETAQDVMQAMEKFYRNMDKKPVTFVTFVAGYVANRLQAAVGLEINRMLDEGWASARIIDDSIKYGLALRMALMGALMKADFTGLDLMQQGLANRSYEPPAPQGASATLDRLIAEGRRGVMSGAGYFDYGGMDVETLFRNRDIGLLRLKAEVARVETDTPLGR